MDTTRTTTTLNSAAAVTNPSIISHLALLSSSPCGVETRPYWEPILSCTGKVADIASASHNRTHGSTVSLLHGCMAGTKLYSVPIYRRRSINFWERPTWDDFFEFAKGNLDLLAAPAHALESWYNDREFAHVVEVVVCLPDLTTAMDVGFHFNLPSIFDIHARREISIPESCRHAMLESSPDGLLVEDASVQVLSAKASETFDYAIPVAGASPSVIEKLCDKCRPPAAGPYAGPQCEECLWVLAENGEYQ